MKRNIYKNPTYGTSGRYFSISTILVLGLFIRLIILYIVQDSNLIIHDEHDYFQLAKSLLHSGEFSLNGVLTSLRPPLYPFLVSLVWKVSGLESLTIIRLFQILLNLINVYLVYRLGLTVFNRRVGLWAAAGFCVYPSFIGFNLFILTEILFSLLVTLTALSYALLVRTDSLLIAFGTGCALGLACLTRAVLSPFPIVLCLLAFFTLSAEIKKRLVVALFIFLGYILVTAPWAVRNSMLHQVFTGVETTGGFSLYMGNNNLTPSDRPWDWTNSYSSLIQALSMENQDDVSLTEGQKSKLAMQKALTYMMENPLLTCKRAVLKFANFWGLERVVTAAWQKGAYQPPYKLAAIGILLIAISYILLMICACAGFFLAAPLEFRQIHWFLVLLVVFIMGIHTITFGHPRYHLPLVPILFLYASAAITSQSWLRLKTAGLKSASVILSWAILLTIWGREVLVVDVDMIRGLLQLIFI